MATQYSLVLTAVLGHVFELLGATTGRAFNSGLPVRATLVVADLVFFISGSSLLVTRTRAQLHCVRGVRRFGTTGG